MENYILLCVFIMCLCGIFAVADLCVSILDKILKSISNKRSNKYFDYKL